MSNPNPWSSPFYNNQNFFTSSTTTSTTVTTTTTTTTANETTSTDSRQTGRITKPARKRSRASRKTPTTLLTTDTSNFRAMVQQFTGEQQSSTMAFGSGNNNTSGFTLTSLDPSVVGSSQHTTWPYNINPHAPPPQMPYMFNVNNPNTVVSGSFGAADGGGGGGFRASSKEETNNNNNNNNNSNDNNSRLQ
ncbi:unnamed protein product [Cochlearia groenlandica]